MSDRKINQIELTLSNWVAWAKFNKDPNEKYDMSRPSICATGQFCAAHGIPYPLALNLDYGLNFACVFYDKPHTFGAAIARAEAAMAATD